MDQCAVFYRDNLTEDWLLVFPENCVISRDVAVEAIRKENKEGRRWAEVYFDEVSSQRLRITDDVTLLLFKAIARWAHEATSITSLCTTAYLRRGGRWKAAHHQQSYV